MHGLERFEDAQCLVYGQVLGELRDGRKRSHWIWFIFPQGEGLGSSYNSRFYALTPEEAHEYLGNPVLAHRLRACTELVISWVARGRSLEVILGDVDAKKFRSCIELFSFDPYFRTARERIDAEEAKWPRSGSPNLEAQTTSTSGVTERSSI